MEQGGNGPTCPEPYASSLPLFPAWPPPPAQQVKTTTIRSDGSAEVFPPDELFPRGPGPPLGTGIEAQRPAGSQCLRIAVCDLGALLGSGATVRQAINGFHRAEGEAKLTKWHWSRVGGIAVCAGIARRPVTRSIACFDSAGRNCWTTS